MSTKVDNEAMEERFIKLETTVAFHEETIAALSDVIHEQHKLIEGFKDRLKHAEERMAEGGSGNVISADLEVPPPHY